MTTNVVLEAHRGLVVAPAGCGKTHLITETLAIPQSKPYLVLTHTTAGVAALKQKLTRLNVPAAQYVVSTIDSWSIQIASKFPNSCPLNSTMAVPKLFYPELRLKVLEFIMSNAITSAIQASYSRILVDEYQDCNQDQHQLICTLSEILPTIIFGDPMQSIFSFAGPMPSWQDVENHFPVICELNTPWRWINAGAPELGAWLLECRRLLLNNLPINLQGRSNYIHWHTITSDPQKNIANQISAQYNLLNTSNGESILIIGNSSNARSRHEFASFSRGFDVVEPVGLEDLIELAEQIDKSTDTNSLFTIIFMGLKKMMTGLDIHALIKRLESIQKGRNRNPSTPMEQAVIHFLNQNDAKSHRELIKEVIIKINAADSVRTYRKSACTALMEIVSLSVDSPEKTMKECAENIRERRRHQGDKRISHRAIGSTLLLKGLEANHVMILDATEMSPQDLYVALSRGAKSIVVFSNNHILPKNLARRT